MFDDRSRKYKNQYVPLEPVNVDDYKEFVGGRVLRDLKHLAKPLRKKVWANVNSTFVGGGVAEMLQSKIPFANALGIDCRWFVIEGTQEFFTVTKKFHNLLQGVDQDINMDEIFHAYLEIIQENLERTALIGDFVVIHDPQPAAVIMSGNIYGHIIWRCHIDTSNASQRIWRFLLPYINQYDGAIFTSGEFVKDGLQIPIYEIPPCIDPLRRKNKQYTKKQALDILSSLFIEHNVDAERPIIAAISRYDMHKNQKTIIDAFKMMKKNISSKIKPLLILIGNSASDDPEGAKMYEEILKDVGGDADIHAWCNVPNNDRVVGALMHLAKCFVHISTKEGFGLVVSEAMWQGTPVIGSNIGGIKKQIVHTETGFIVEPNDTARVAKKMKYFIEDEDQAKIMGENSREYVRSNFLLPTVMKQYLELMRHSLEINRQAPSFRINDITYKEITAALYGRKKWPFSKKVMRRSLDRKFRRKEVRKPE